MSGSSPETGMDVSPKSAVDLVMEMMAIPGKSCEEGRVVEYMQGVIDV